MVLRKPLISKHLLQPYSIVTPHHFPPPSNQQLALLADKCTSMRQIQQIHAQMLVSPTIHDHFVASRLLSFSALSNHGDPIYAFKLFKSVQQPNMFMWNTLIRGLAASPDPRQALFLYIKMRRLGVKPGKHTFPFILKACAYSQSLRSCKQVHAHVVKFGLDLEQHVANGLVRGYCVSCSLKDARQVFDEIPERNATVCTTMVCGYAQNDCGQDALALFDQMIAHKFEPNGPILASVLSACAQSGCLDLGEKIHRYLKEKGIESGVILGTALVNMYAKNGAIAMASNCFDKMPERNIITWNAMISGLAVHGYAKEALEFFQKLEKDIVVPNDSTFVAVLSACCHAGMLDFGREIFHSMKSIYGIEPKLKHYGCMVDLLGRVGNLLEAEDLIKTMPCKADLKIWGALLSACSKHTNLEIAERVVQEMLVLDQHNHGAYVVLSNMYANAGRWEDVSRLREVIKHEHLRKTPGWSLVDGDD